MKLLSAFLLFLSFSTLVLPSDDPLDLFWQRKYKTLSDLFPDDRRAALSEEHKSILIEAELLNGNSDSASHSIYTLFPNTPAQKLPLPLQFALALFHAELEDDHLLFSSHPRDPRCQYYIFLFLMQRREFTLAEKQLNILYKTLQRQNPLWHYYLRQRIISFLAPFLSDIESHCHELLKVTKTLNISSYKKSAAELNRFLQPLFSSPQYSFQDKTSDLHLPLLYYPKTQHPYIRIKIAGHFYTILLDSGNAEGWIIHSMDLLERTKSRLGQRRLTRMGTGSTYINSQVCLTPQLPMGTDQLTNITGVFIPKPSQDFTDANLNPSMIKNCIITMDFIANEIILQTQDVFHKQKSIQFGQMKKAILPWLGFQYILTRIPFQGKQTLMQIETGASGITLLKKFADRLSLGTINQAGYDNITNTNRFRSLPFTLAIRNIVITDPKAEIWPMPDFHINFSGMVPDIILGPKCLIGRTKIVLDPFSRQFSLYSE